MSEKLNALLNEFHVEKTLERKQLANWIDGLTDEELQRVVKDTSPYGPMIPAADGSKEKNVSFSYTNMQMQTMRELVVTSMIGFLYRMNAEWQVPDEIKPIDIDEWIKNPSLADTPAWVKDKRLKDLHEENRKTMVERAAVKKFLDNLFRFNPDKHAVSAYRGNKADPSRKLPNTDAVKEAVTAGNTVRRVPAKDYEPKPDDLKHEPVTPQEKAAFGTIPPRDTFARYDRYLDEHYEEYLQLTHDLYGSQMDIDIAVNIYAMHNSKKEGDEFKSKHMDQVIAPITNVQANRWVILGPYRQNRERVDFLNRHTEVLKAMLDAREQDSHIATDIMKKRAKIKKAQNVKEAGPDHEEFTKWAKANRPDVHKMGGQYLGADTKEETKAPTATVAAPATTPAAPVAMNGNEVKTFDPPGGAKTLHPSSIDERDDCPRDAVEVGVFEVSNGGEKVEVTKIYNPIEKPDGGQTSSTVPAGKKEVMPKKPHYG